MGASVPEDKEEPPVGDIVPKIQRIRLVLQSDLIQAFPYNMKHTSDVWIRCWGMRPINNKSHSTPSGKIGKVVGVK